MRSPGAEASFFDSLLERKVWSAVDGMYAVIVAGSDLERPLRPDLLACADLLIAADGGADSLAAAGFRPHLLVGDFDSIDEGTRATLEAAGIETLILPVAKDETDTEVALRLAVERGAQRITVYGALGGPRLDHMVAVLLLLTAEWLAPVDVRLVDERHEMLLAKGDCEIEGAPGDLVSLLPLSPVVEDIRTEGLLYPLRGEPLRQGAARGVSNELLGTRARIVHGSGDLLVMHYSMAPAGRREEE
ncbi:MAG: thiamine diphosphokinase [Thermoleophilia bacterium]